MAKNLITPGQSLRRIMSREIVSTYSFFGKDYYFQDLIIDAISSIILSNEGEKNNYIIGIDKEEDVINNLNSNSLFSQKSVIVVKNSKKIKSKFQSEILDYCKAPTSDKVLIFIFDDPYATNKFIDELSPLSTCVDVRSPFPNKMREWAKYYSKKNNFNLSDDIINQLVENYGDNINNVINEIDKLHLYSNGKMEQINSIINSNIYKKENQVWKLLDSVGKKNISSSIDIYTQLYNNNTPMIRILLNLLDLFKELINQKLKIKEGKFIRNKIILKNLNSYSRNFSAEQILNAVTLLRDCDLIIKTTSMNEKYFFYSILVEVCEGYDV